ncbi:FAD-dependent oxidoreductase [Streptomyces sp. NPDC048639]|uniref:FAD-dependent oxidoreductase n=1 Tax=Streptomyces sp. NPDC048639 TaxID=3365581 RepID=UPI00371A3B4B
MTPPDLVPDSLVQVLRERAEQRPEQPVYHSLARGADAPVRVLTFGGLDRQARAIAVALRDRCPSAGRALLPYPPGLDFVVGFFGCLYAGVVPVPVYPPNPTRLERTLPRLEAIAADAEAAVLLSTAPVLSFAEPLLGDRPNLGGLACIATDEVDASSADSWCRPDIDPHTPALIQYTSGSTSAPKGVMLSHANVIANCRQMLEKIDADPRAGSRFVSWLPLYHDFGLITSVLYTAWSGGQSWLMSPIDFISDPLSWLEAIGKYRGTISAVPNFALDLCVRRARPDRLSGLDLSSLRLSLCGGEPVSQQTLERFTTTFAPYGLRPDCLFPAYGMAECTVVATAGRLGRPWRHRRVEADLLARGQWRHAAPTSGRSPQSREPQRTRSQDMVGSGAAMAGTRVLIVDPDTHHPCPPGRVGEIWVSGPQVGLGYWNRPEESERVFRARLEGDERPYLRSGDLGVLDDGELFVTGRRKDVIFVAGRTIYPQDIERTVGEADGSLRPGAAAAFGVARDGTEEIVVVQEAGRRCVGGDPTAVCEAISQAVHAEHALPVSRVVLIAPGSIPKTSSGKIQRSASKAALEAGELTVVTDWRPSERRRSSDRVKPPARTGPPRQPQVCVIGAGPAGLTAAFALQQRGYERITIVERGDRVGGRTTDFADPTGGYYGDVFLGSDRYTTIRTLADRVGAAPMFEDPSVASTSPAHDQRLAQRFLWTPERITSVEEHLRFTTAHADPSNHDVALSELLTMSGYGFPAEVCLPYFRLLGSVAPPTSHEPARFHLRPGFFPELWQRLARHLTDRPGTQLLLRTEVTGVRVEPPGGGDGPLVRVHTTTSPDGSLFDRVLVASLPKDALRFLDAQDYTAAHGLFGKVKYNDYAVTAFTATGLAGNRYVLRENFEPARRGHVMAVHRRGDIWYALQYDGPKTDPQDCLADDVATLGGTVDEVLLHRRLPFFPHVSDGALASGFYRELEELQGRSNTFFLGALPGFDLTESVARHATALIEDRFAPYGESAEANATTDAGDDNEGQVERWGQLVGRFPAVPPQLPGLLPRYFRLRGSEQVHFTPALDESVMRGVLEIDADPAINGPLRSGPWAMSGELPVAASLMSVPNPDSRYDPIFMWALKMNVPADCPSGTHGAVSRGMPKELWLLFTTLPTVFPLTLRWPCELMEGLLNGDVDHHMEFDDGGKARQRIGNPLLAPFDTSGGMIFESPAEVGVLHLVPRRNDAHEEIHDASRAMAAVRPHLLRGEAAFDLMIQARPKNTLPFVGADMQRDDWVKWNESVPWSTRDHPLRKLGTLTFPVQDVDSQDRDDLGLTAAGASMAYHTPWTEPTQLLPPLMRACRGIAQLPQPVTQAEFRRTGRRSSIEEMLVSRVREVSGVSVDRTSNLVDLGLASVELVQLAQYVQAVLHVDVPATMLIDLPDIGSAVNYLEAVMEGRPFVPERRIRTILLRAGQRASDAGPESAPTTVCCFPPIVGSGDVYRALSAELGSAVLLRTMNNLLFYQEVVTDLMLPQMGQEYADEIQRQQPEGPYHLLGYSFGGLLAYETAHVLTRRGAQISTLVCLDGPAPHSLATLVEINKGRVDPDTLTGRMITAAIAGGADYIPPRLDRSIHLVRARDDKVFGLQDRTLGWAAAGVRTVLHEVPGDHLSMMKRPGVAEVSGIVRALLTADVPSA